MSKPKIPADHFPENIVRRLAEVLKDDDVLNNSAQRAWLGRQLDSIDLFEHGLAEAMWAPPGDPVAAELITAMRYLHGRLPELSQTPEVVRLNTIVRNFFKQHLPEEG